MPSFQPEAYIPHSRAEVIDRCRALISDTHHDAFTRFATMLTAWYHYSYHSHLEQLKFEYNKTPEAFARNLDRIVRAANFTQIIRHDLEEALAEESTFRVRLSVNFDDFEEIVFYRRGEERRCAQIPAWFGLTQRELEFTNYDQVLVYVRFRGHDHFPDREDLNFEPGSSMLKLFQNIPKADLEMLFPNTEVRMRLTDKLFIGVPAFVSGIIVLTTKLGGSLLLLAGIFSFWAGMRDEPVVLDQAALAALLTAAGTLGAYLWKQYSNFKNRKIRFMKVLAESLYFKNLDNDIGVLANLIDHAEESETKEVLLAYTELLVSGPMDRLRLQQAINGRFDQAIEFDIEDAVAKLTRLDLIDVVDDRLAARSIQDALVQLDTRWDAIFSGTQTT